MGEWNEPDMPGEAAAGLLTKLIEETDFYKNHLGPLLASKPPWIAAALGLFFPPAGWLYLDQYSKAFVMAMAELPFACIAYSCVAPAVILHVFGAYDAWVLAKRRRAGKELGEWEWFWNKE
jgi:hypothetical protein